MSTSTVDLSAVGSISTEKVTYRAYIKTSADKDGKPVIDKLQAKAASGKLDKESGLPENWARAEKEGMTVFNENEFVRYAVKTKDAAALLIPDETQYMYIFQAGLNYLQNAKANAVSVAQKEGTPEPEAEFNGLTIDLRIGTDNEGTNSINEAPTRRAQTDEEKLIKMLKASNKTDEQIQQILAIVRATAAASSTDEDPA